MVKQSNQQIFHKIFQKYYPKSQMKNQKYLQQMKNQKYLLQQMKKKLTLYIGISGSGKSREAQKYQDAVEINRDRLRFLLFCNGIENWEKYKFTKSNEILLQKNVLKYGNRLF